MSKNMLDVEEREVLRRTEIRQTIEWSKSDNQRQRKSLIKRLRQVQAPDQILPLLGDRDQETRLEAIEALGCMKHVLSGALWSEEIGHLVGTLNDPNRRVVAAAAQALGSLQVKEAVPALREFLGVVNGKDELSVIEPVEENSQLAPPSDSGEETRFLRHT
jgi:hypothetical protein